MIHMFHMAASLAVYDQTRTWISLFLNNATLFFPQVCVSGNIVCEEARNRRRGFIFSGEQL